VTRLDEAVGVVVQTTGERAYMSGIVGVTLDQHPAEIHGLAGTADLLTVVVARAGVAGTRKQIVDPPFQILVRVVTLLRALRTPDHRFPLLVGIQFCGWEPDAEPSIGCPTSDRAG
jgi:hypothetical protein